jgi:hypothetical protein
VALRPEEDLAGKFGVKACPANFVIGRDGRIRARFSGFPVEALRIALGSATKE